MTLFNTLQKVLACSASLQLRLSLHDGPQLCTVYGITSKYDIGTTSRLLHLLSLGCNKSF